ncbi:hypothetical protein ACJX0J_041417 [Zea mays]
MYIGGIVDVTFLIMYITGDLYKTKPGLILEYGLRIDIDIVNGFVWISAAAQNSLMIVVFICTIYTNDTFFKKKIYLHCCHDVMMTIKKELRFAKLFVILKQKKINNGANLG